MDFLLECLDKRYIEPQKWLSLDFHKNGRIAFAVIDLCMCLSIYLYGRQQISSSIQQQLRYTYEYRRSSTKPKPQKKLQHIFEI